MSIGNYVRLRYGLPPIAAALAMLLLTMTSTTLASRHCLDYSGVVQPQPRRVVAKERGGCWTFDHHPPRSEVPLLTPETILPGLEPPTRIDKWRDTDPLDAKLRLLEP